MALATPAPLATAPSAAVALPVIALRELAPWLLLAVLSTVAVLFFVGSEQGATSLFAGTAVHEFVHDARHLLGYPCH